MTDFGFAKQWNESAFLKGKTINPRLIKSQMVTLQALNIPCYYCVALTFLQSQSPQQELLPP